jgi:hypothetical protein
MRWKNQPNHFLSPAEPAQAHQRLLAMMGEQGGFVGYAVSAEELLMDLFP